MNNWTILAITKYGGCPGGKNLSRTYAICRGAEEIFRSSHRPYTKPRLYHRGCSVRDCESWSTAYLLHHCHCYTFFLLVNKFLIRLVDGTMATLANQGVAEILRISLSGNNAFVIAYAVASL